MSKICNFDFLYVQGYTAALQDALSVFQYIQEDLKGHKRKQNCKTYKAILECMIDGRSILRENPDAFVRCNDSVPGGFEIFIQNKK